MRFKIPPNSHTRYSFLYEADRVHNFFYNYDKTDFIKVKHKIIVSCTLHGDFTIRAKDHLEGSGCPKCGIIKIKKLITKSYDDFVKDATKTHGKRYVYYKKTYVNTDTKMKMKCKKHGIFEQTPKKHIQGNGCPKCAIEQQTQTKEEFVKKAQSKYGNKYDYSKFEYRNSRIKSTIICTIHGIEFLQSPAQHCRAEGCKMCCNNSSSKMENAWLDSLNVVHRNVKLNLNNRDIIVDGIKDNIVYEFLGDFWHGNPEIFNGNDINKKNKKTFHELYEKTIKRIEFIKENGYEVITIWENEWKNIKKIS